MPFYTFKCPSCGDSDDALLTMGERDNAYIFCKCGTRMNRVISASTFKMKQSGRDMALNSLNGQDIKHMKPGYIASAAKGLERPVKTIY